MNLYVELFGYLGTLLVFISMTTSSIKKLRILNISGSVITVIYSVIISAYPIVFLNLGLSVVNFYKLITESKKGEKQ
jgi:hypothetical protein